MQVEEKTKLVCQPEGYYGPLTERELVVSPSGTFAEAVPSQQAFILTHGPRACATQRLLSEGACNAVKLQFGHYDCTPSWRLLACRTCGRRSTSITGSG